MKNMLVSKCVYIFAKIFLLLFFSFELYFLLDEHEEEEIFYLSFEPFSLSWTQASLQFTFSFFLQRVEKMTMKMRIKALKPLFIFCFLLSKTLSFTLTLG